MCLRAGTLSVPARGYTKGARIPPRGGGKVRGASLRSGKMRGTEQGINARRWVICEAGMCEAQGTTGTAGVIRM